MPHPNHDDMHTTLLCLGACDGDYNDDDDDDDDVTIMMTIAVLTAQFG